MPPILALLLLAAAAGAQKAAPPPDARAKVDQIFARYDRSDSPGCAVGASIDDKPVISAAYGMADLEHDVKLTPESIFEPGSVTKQFTAAAILLLAQSGKLSLDDSIRKYVPELPEAYAPVTIRHMLNHTAGLRDWGSIGAIAGWPRTTRAYTTAHLMDILVHQQALNYPVGAAYSYSNTGYNLAAIVVNRVSGKTLADFTRDEIFAPLGMSSTTWRDDFRRVVKRRAIAYQQGSGAWRQLMPFEDVHGQGGMLTTVADLLKWNANFQTARLGGRAFVEQQLVRGRLTGGQEIAYAAGLNLLTYRGLREVSHSGTTAAYNAWLGRYPDQGLSVAVLCNAGNANGTQLGRAVAAVYLGAALLPAPASTAKVSESQAGRYRNTQDYAVLNIAAGADATRYRFEGTRLRVSGDYGDTVYEKVDPWTPSAQELEAFRGVYISDEAEVTLRIGVEGGKLVAHRPPDTIALAPVYRDGFTAPGLGIIRFLRDSSGRVAELSVSESRVWDLRFRRKSEDGEGLVRRDHYVRVKSSVPAISGQTAQIYVREVSRAGNAAGRVVLFVHGAGTPGEVAFDVPYHDYSWMAYLARAGYDVFAMDFTGYGRSTRPAAMNDPCNLSPQQQAGFVPSLVPAPCSAGYGNNMTTIASDWDDLGAVVDYLRALRNVERVSLIGWSQGGPRSAGYAARNPQKVESLVLLSPAYGRNGRLEPPAQVPAAGVAFNTQTAAEFDANWDRQVGCSSQIDPEARKSVWSQMLESDPVGATWGAGVRRAPLVTSWGWNAAVAGKLSLPVLLVAPAHDKQVAPERVQELYADLGTRQKVLVDLACSSHNAAWERNHVYLFKASLDWLNGAAVNGAKEGIVRLGY